MKMFVKLSDVVCALFWTALLLMPFFMYLWGYGI